MEYKDLAPIVQRAFQTGLDKTKTRFGGVNATGSLRKSIKAAPVQDGIEISMNSYGLMINEGTRPSKYAGGGKGNGNSPMVKSLLMWIDAKRIKPKFGTKLGLALAIRQSIWSNGIRANHWLDSVLDHMLDENSETYKYFEQMAVEDIEEQIIELIETLEGI